MRPKPKRRADKQLSLAARAQPGARGGAWRARAGRPRIPEHKRTFVAHRQRPSLPKSTPLHVTIRLVEGYPPLRRRKPVRWIRRCIQLAHKERFRVIEFSIQGNHLHLIVEADDRRWLGRGMQGLKVRLARRLNLLFRRQGTVFRERYHCRQLRSPREVRHGLHYVLNNRRRHARHRVAKDWIDPFSSAPSFRGWGSRTVTSDEDVGEPVTRRARCYLLRSGWKRGGLLDPNMVPGPAP